jgi:hypothetical protein
MPCPLDRCRPAATKQGVWSAIEPLRAGLLALTSDLFFAIATNFANRLFHSILGQRIVLGALLRRSVAKRHFKINKWLV